MGAFMLLRLFLLTLLAISSVAAGSLTDAHAQSDTVIRVPNEDPEIAAAIAKARTTLPQFWKAYAHPGPGEEGFALKIAIKDGADVEHFWLIDVGRDGDKYYGTINNTPEIVGNVSAGDRHEFTASDISDWLYQRNGKIVGNETMRPLLKRMPPEVAEQYRAMLETP